MFFQKPVFFGGGGWGEGEFKAMEVRDFCACFNVAKIHCLAEISLENQTNATYR